MGARLRRHVRSNIIGYLALFLALGGTASALEGHNTVFTDDIVNGEVRTGDVRNDTLVGGGLAAKDLRIGSVRSSEVLDDSLAGADVDESSLGQVPSAVNAEHATNADHADTASNSEKLGDQGAAAYQRRVIGTCSGGEAITKVNADGTVTCDSAVQRIFSRPNAGQIRTAFEDFFVGVFVRVTCHDGGTLLRISHGFASDTATLNWLYSNGSNVNANGTLLPNDDTETAFGFAGTRIEGQFIVQSIGGVATLSIHAYDGGSFCEVFGTAAVAPS